MNPFVANTDRAWFDDLAGRAQAGRVDEANFWSPVSTKPMARLPLGAPVFLRLKEPVGAIAGYGFFAQFSVLGLEEAWDFFDWRNGDPDYARFLARIGAYRGLNLLDPRSAPSPLGCTVLRDLRFWDRTRWIPWREAEGWQRNIVRGKREADAVRARRLLDEIVRDAAHQEVEREFAPAFVPLDVDHRTVVTTQMMVREGQGTFRTRLLDAYGRRCAITGERTEIVLEAAHIQPYLGPRSNHVQNGVVLTREFHTLFDRGLVTITPDYRVQVSPAIHRRWSNGRRYYAYDEKPLAHVPSAVADRPSPDALAWRLRTLYRD
jgi:putative restriction endonuclease